MKSAIEKPVDTRGGRHTFTTGMTMKPQIKSMRTRVDIKPCDGTWYSVALPGRVSDREGESP